MQARWRRRFNGFRVIGENYASNKKRTAKKENVIKAVVFGSRARGDYKYNSDIDLAVYYEGELPLDLFLDLDEAAGIYKIDVIDMNRPLDERLRQEIERQGVEIYRQA